MYHTHFALDGIPFRNTPDTAMFFPGSNRGAVFQALNYAINRGEGLITVIGEVGSGKTMLCRMIAQSVAPEVQLIYLPNPMLSPEQAIQTIARELGLRLGPRADAVSTLEKLNAQLLKLHDQGRHAVLLVEEAQAMPRETLEQIRLLGNLETHHAKLLQVVLFAQPELKTMLSEHGMRQLRDRISHAFNLTPLSRNEIRDYLQFRLTPCNGTVESLFSTGAIRAIQTHSRGMIRRVNLLADKCLLSAYARGALQAEASDVRLAAQDSAFSKQRLPHRLRTWFTAGALVALTTLLAINTTKTDTTQFVDKALDRLASTAKLTHNPIVSDDKIALTTPITTSPEPLIENSLLPADLPVAPLEQVQPDLTATRLAATKRWLGSVDPSRYTLQLRTAFITRPNQLSGLEQILKREELRTYADQLFLLPGRVGEENVYVLSYAEFPNYRTAQQAIEKFPPELSRFRPLIRTIASLRTELAE